MQRNDARTRRTDYEQSRPAPSAAASLTLAVALPVAVLAVTAAPPATALLAVLPLVAARYRR
ncbi:hypothetical protein [Halorarius halobius]|uniref:hypothetical protein n=1 Tax=Halorarius halobius TaxID=2962671 RepID=UPI0020CDBEC9|nr:hypothetical protein [Halorarius halobius]